MDLLRGRRPGEHLLGLPALRLGADVVNLPGCGGQLADQLAVVQELAESSVLGADASRSARPFRAIRELMGHG